MLISIFLANVNVVRELIGSPSLSGFYNRASNRVRLNEHNQCPHPLIRKFVLIFHLVCLFGLYVTKVIFSLNFTTDSCTRILLPGMFCKICVDIL